MSFYKTKISKVNFSLVETFSVNDEKCKNPNHYNEYLRQNALLDMEQGLGVTYLFVEQNDETKEKHIMGYISLRMSSLIKDMGETKKFGFPALEISELAVDKKYAGLHIGTDMVLDAINIANELNDISSIKYLILCADPESENFYKKIDFMKLRSMEEIPREHCNMTCTPMYLKLR